MLDNDGRTTASLYTVGASDTLPVIMVAPTLPYADADCLPGIPVEVNDYGSRIFIPPVVGFRRSLTKLDLYLHAVSTVTLLFVVLGLIRAGGRLSPAILQSLAPPMLFFGWAMLNSIEARRRSITFEITADTFAMTEVSMLGAVRIRRWNRHDLQYSNNSLWGMSSLTVRRASSRVAYVRVPLDKAGVERLQQLLLDASTRQYAMGDPPVDGFTYLSGRESRRWLRSVIFAVAAPLIAVSVVVLLVANWHGDRETLAWPVLTLSVLLLHLNR